MIQKLILITILVTSSAYGCVDLVNPSTGTSDCARLSSYCRSSVYIDLMRVQCPATCGFCGSSSGTSTTSTTTCVDKTNPSTGISDCSRLSSYCTKPIYVNLMRDQCPKTCGFCSSNSTPTVGSTSTVSRSTSSSPISTTSSTSCEDAVNSATGTSDCQRLTAYCTNSVYASLMRVQCPKTCGFC